MAMKSRHRNRLNEAYAPNSRSNSPTKHRQTDPEERQPFAEPDLAAEEPATCEEGEPSDAGEPPRRHIHPCMCDIDKRRLAAIREHMKRREIAQLKYLRRIREIEEELRMAEEEEVMRRRQLEEEKEFYGDEYETEGSKKKRKKRSARRASMVSLGVRQIINWKKEPRIEVKFTVTSRLRREHPTYCKALQPSPRTPRPPVNWSDSPKIPIRTTKTVTLRSLEVQKKIAFIQKQQKVIKYPNRPPFTLSAYA